MGGPPQYCLIESLLFTQGGGYFLLERHLARLARSAEVLGFAFERFDTYSKLEQFANTLTAPTKVRLLLSATGNIELTAQAVSGNGRCDIALSPLPVDSGDWTLRHKTTLRKSYDAALSVVSGASDVVLHNERGELTETCIGNLVLDLEGALLTPPLASGLLPGTFRAHLLQGGLLRERTLTIEDIGRARAVFRINSVRLWTPLDVVKG